MAIRKRIILAWCLAQSVFWSLWLGCNSKNIPYTIYIVVICIVKFNQIIKQQKSRISPQKALHSHPQIHNKYHFSPRNLQWNPSQPLPPAVPRTWPTWAPATSWQSWKRSRRRRSCSSWSWRMPRTSWRLGPWHGRLNLAVSWKVGKQRSEVIFYRNVLKYI